MRDKLTPEQIQNLMDNLAQAANTYMEERKRIIDQLVNGCGKTHTAQLLGIDRKTLYNIFYNGYKIKGSGDISVIRTHELRKNSQVHLAGKE